MIDLEKLREKTQECYGVVMISESEFIALLDYAAQLEKDVDQQNGRADFWNARARVHRKARSKLFWQVRKLEKDAGRWRAVAHLVDLNDFAVVEYDNFGDSRVITGDEADSLIDTAMEAKHG